MRTRLVLAAGALTVVAASTVPALAAPGDNGNGVGGCIDQLYGNATNPRPSGHGTLPSQSPGPSLNNPTDPSNPIPGGPTVGDINQAIHDSDAAAAAGIHSTSQLCRIDPTVFDTP